MSKLQETAALVTQRLAELQSTPAREANSAQQLLEPDLAEAAELLAEVTALKAEHGPALAELASRDWVAIQLRYNVPENLTRQLYVLCRDAHLLLEHTFTTLTLVSQRAKQIQDVTMANGLRNEIRSQRGNAQMVRNYVKRLTEPRQDRNMTFPSLLEDLNSRLAAVGLPASTKTYLKTERREMPTSYVARNPGGDEGLEGQPR